MIPPHIALQARNSAKTAWCESTASRVRVIIGGEHRESDPKAQVIPPWHFIHREFVLGPVFEPFRRACEFFKGSSKNAASD